MQIGQQIKDFGKQWAEKAGQVMAEVSSSASCPERLRLLTAQNREAANAFNDAVDRAFGTVTTPDSDRRRLAELPWSDITCLRICSDDTLIEAAPLIGICRERIFFNLDILELFRAIDAENEGVATEAQLNRLHTARNWPAIDWTTHPLTPGYLTVIALRAIKPDANQCWRLHDGRIVRFYRSVAA